MNGFTPMASAADGILALISDPEAVKQRIESLKQAQDNLAGETKRNQETLDKLQALNGNLGRERTEIDNLQADLTKREEKLKADQIFYAGREAILDKKQTELEQKRKLVTDQAQGQATYDKELIDRGKAIVDQEAKLEKKLLDLNNREAMLQEAEKKLSDRIKAMQAPL